MGKNTGLFVLEVKAKGKPPKITADILPSERPRWQPEVQIHLDSALLEALDMYDKRKHSLDYFKRLLLAGANPNAKHANHGNYRPLHHAVRIGNHRLCKLLLENGANPNLKNNLCSVPLHSAVFRMDTKMCLLLIEHGASIGIRDENGMTPLECIEEHPRTVRLLRAASQKTKESEKGAA
jgi:ankyrin repeat protein